MSSVLSAVTSNGSPISALASSFNNRVLPVPFLPKIYEIELPGIRSCWRASVWIKSPSSVAPLGVSMLF